MLVVLYFGIKAGAPHQIVKGVEQINDFALTLIAALPAWLALSVVRAAYGVQKDEQALGNHDKHRFIPHEPILIATERFEASDGGTEQRLIFFRHAEPDGFVHCTIECTPMVNQRVRAIISGGRPGPHKVLNDNWFGGQGQFMGTRLPRDRSATLSVSLLPATVPVVIRVYCHDSFVGKDGNSPI